MPDNIGSQLTVALDPRVDEQIVQKQMMQTPAQNSTNEDEANPNQKTLNLEPANNS